MQEKDRYHGKVFCGTFAKDGDLFLTAAQGNYFPSIAKLSLNLKNNTLMSINCYFIVQNLASNNCFFAYYM